MPITPPAEKNWWDIPIGVHEKIWLTLVVLVGLGLFIMMPLWHLFGRQNSPTTTYRVSPESFFQKTTEWSKTATSTAGQPPRPPGQDVYLVAQRYTWFPSNVVLQAGVPYRLHLSSKDVNHGFSIHQDGDAAQKANFQVVPGYEYVLTMSFRPGTYHIVCQEYCGLGHQYMLGKLTVEGGS